MLYFSRTGDLILSKKWYGWSVQSVPETYAESVAHIQKIAIEDADHMNAAIEKQDIHLCDTIQNTSKIVECQDMLHAGEALITKDLSKCDQLMAVDTVRSCRDAVYSAKAQAEGERTSCTSISVKWLRDYCEKEVDTKRLNTALEGNSLSVDFCNTLSGEVAVSCQKSLARVDNTHIYTDALDQKDPKLCDTLVDATFRENCHDAVVLQLAMNEKQSELCGTIFDPTRREYCESALKLRDDVNRLQEVVAGGDIALCNSFSEKKIQYQCSDMITLAQVRLTHDQNLCGNLFNTGMQFACMQIANAIH